MNDLERFKAIAHFEKPDYVPIFGMPSAPGMSWGAMRKTHEHLVAQGMPPEVGGMYDSGGPHDVENWFRYWGTTGPACMDFGLARGAKGFAQTSRIEGEFEIIESESGEITRQVIDNDITYAMPEFIQYPVRDRASWEFFRERNTPSDIMPADEMEAHCRRFDKRARPLAIGAGSTYGAARAWMGPEAVSFAFYEAADIIEEMMEFLTDNFRKYTRPLIERLRPEIVALGEDHCYNHGMLLSPALFEKYCAPYYREVTQLARDCGVDMVTVDTAGNAMQFVPIAERLGVNSLHPFEVKAGNDLFALRERHPKFILMGWLEKEVVNEGNESLIEEEIMSKVPRLLEKGGYFPNGDHGIQPFVSFMSLCKFMTLLHEVTGNPEGEFPRVR